MSYRLNIDHNPVTGDWSATVVHRVDGRAGLHIMEWGKSRDEALEKVRQEVEELMREVEREING